MKKIKARGLSLPPPSAPTARAQRAAAAVQGGGREKLSYRLPRGAHRLLRMLAIGSSPADVLARLLDAHAADPARAVFTRESAQVARDLDAQLHRRGLAVEDLERPVLTSVMLTPVHARQLRELAAGHGLPVGAVLLRLLVA